VSSLPALATQAEFATIAGVQRSYVTALKKAGRLVLDADGKVRVVESLARIEATRDPSKAAVAARHAEARGGALPAAELPVDEAGPEPESTSVGFSYWRERTEKAKALAAERENAIADGKLLAVDDVVAQVANAMTVLRNALERLPDTLGPQLAAEQSEARCRGLVSEAVELLLEDTSRRLGAIAGEGA
jgi:hypothetical protein